MHKAHAARACLRCPCTEPVLLGLAWPTVNEIRGAMPPCAAPCPGLPVMPPTGLQHGCRTRPCRGRGQPLPGASQRHGTRAQSSALRCGRSRRARPRLRAAAVHDDSRWSDSNSVSCASPDPSSRVIAKAPGSLQKRGHTQHTQTLAVEL